jgi:hypothetical protein
VVRKRRRRTAALWRRHASRPRQTPGKRRREGELVRLNHVPGVGSILCDVRSLA